MPSQARAPGRARRGGPLLTLLVAGVALLLAVVSLLIAWGANERSRQAQARADAALAANLPRPPAGQGPAPQDSGVPTGPVRPTEGATLDPSAGPVDRPLDPEAEYGVAYEKETLELQAGSSCGTVNVDLDEPRVAVDDDVSDLEFGFSSGSCADQPVFGWQRGDASRVDSPAATPNDCAERIRTAPLGDTVPVRQGVVICVVTSRAAAQERGLTQKVVVVEVLAARDRVATIQVSAWNVPA